MADPRKTPQTAPQEDPSTPAPGTPTPEDPRQNEPIHDPPVSPEHDAPRRASERIVFDENGKPG